MNNLSHYAVSLVRLAVILFVVVFLSYYFAPSPLAPRASEGSESDTLSGYAWSDTIGWLSFNCIDSGSCATSNYGVTVSQTTGDLSGYAWSDNVGWFSFQGADVADCPEAPCTPNVDRGTGAVTGWFKALSGGTAGSGGWDGFVRLNGVTASDSSFSGYAWGSDVTGWVDMSGVLSSASLTCDEAYGDVCTTAQNSCGLRNWGTITCGGTCTAQFAPPESSCEELNFGGICITLTATPKFVGSGGSATLSWDGTCQASACTLYRVDNGQVLSTSTSGSLLQTNITSRRSYVLSCGSDNVSVTVGPSLQFQEF